MAEPAPPPERKPAPPQPWEVAERLYNGTFGVTNQRSLLVAASRFAALDPALREFIGLHLQYLTLATAHGHKRQAGRSAAEQRQRDHQARELLEEVAELLTHVTDDDEREPDAAEGPDDDEREPDAAEVTRATPDQLRAAVELHVETDEESAARRQAALRAFLESQDAEGDGS
jgi:hypothetical protein